MHDLSFTKEIIGVLNYKLKTIPKGSKITAVNVSLSPLSHVKPKGLTETFKAMVNGTGFENIALNIKPLGLKIRCRACKDSFLVNEPTTRCLKCDSPDLDIIYDKEFLVDSIEAEEA